MTLDLRHEPGSRVQSAAFYALKDLARGNVVVLLTTDEPSLMMQSLDLQLRHNLAWTISSSEPGWRVEVRHRADSVPLDVLDLLTRDHQHLDALLAQAMRLVNQADISAATPLLREFAVALERHVAVEDAMLALFSETRADEPVTIMQREHQEILGQFALIGECLAADPPQAGEIGAFCSILSGTLAKHEYREENNLFPQWRRAWARLTAAERNEMMARAQTLLGGAKDEGGRMN
jgi:uncharacterized protein (DUF2249 family)